MKTFDYARAWHDLAVPAYNALPPALRILWEDFRGVEGMRQGADFDTVGCPSDLFARFLTFSTDDLARASRAIYSCGYWDPGIAGGNYSGRFDKYGTGAAWKFANICDQILRARIFGADAEGARYLERDGKAPKSLKACAIHEGMIRETFEDRDSWPWYEVGYAVEGYMSHRPPRPAMKQYEWAALERFGARCKAGEFATPDALQWLNVERFMVEDRGYQGFVKRDKFAAHKEEREARHWAVLTVEAARS